MNTSTLFELLETLGANLVDLHEVLAYTEYLALDQVPEFPGPPPEAAPEPEAVSAVETGTPSRRQAGVPVLGSKDWWQRTMAAWDSCRRPSPARHFLNAQHSGSGTLSPQALRAVLHILGFAHLTAAEEPEAFALLQNTVGQLSARFGDQR